MEKSQSNKNDAYVLILAEKTAPGHNRGRFLSINHKTQLKKSFSFSLRKPPGRLSPGGILQQLVDGNQLNAEGKYLHGRAQVRL